MEQNTIILDLGMLCNTCSEVAEYKKEAETASFIAISSAYHMLGLNSYQFHLQQDLLYNHM